MKRTISALLALLYCAVAAAQVPSDDNRLLLHGSASDWSGALERLIDKRGNIPNLAVSAVLLRLAALDPEHQAMAAKSLYHRGCWPSVRDAMGALLRSPDADVRDASLKTFLHCSDVGMADLILDALQTDHPLRAELADALRAAYVREQAELRGLDGYGRWQAGRDAAAGEREDRLRPILLPLLRDEDAKVRKAAVEAFAVLPDPRVNDALFAMTEDADPGVRNRALWALAYRYDERVLDTLLARADAEQRVWHRHRRFEEVGAAFSPAHFIEFLDAVADATSPQQREDYEYLVSGGLYSDMVEVATLMAALERRADDPDAFIRETARRVLSWRDKRVREGRLQELYAGLPVATLVWWLIIAGLLGLAMLAWVYRLLALRYLIHSTPESKLNALAIGPVAVRGRVLAAPGRGLLSHPMTGEPCVFYGGADRDHPGLQLVIENESGRMPIDTDGAVLLTTEGLLLEGDPIYVLAYASTPARDEGARRILGRSRQPRSKPQRLVQFLVGRLMGANAQSGTARMLFSDPRDICLIWDDGSRPFSSKAELALLLGAITLTGYWVLLFVSSVWALIDRDFVLALQRIFG